MEALCQPGSYSPTGMEPCFLCDKGYYQTKEGQNSCLECSPNKTTSTEGSNSSVQCGGMYLKEIPCVINQVLLLKRCSDLNSSKIYFGLRLSSSFS